MCQRSTCSVTGIFVEGYRKKDTKLHTMSGSWKNGNDWLFLCDTCLRYLKKLQFMLTETPLEEPRCFCGNSIRFSEEECCQV